jgi:hypothetical protein
MSLNAALDRAGKALIIRRPLSRFIQIDRLVTLLTGTGPGSSAPFYLPHARYTMFMSYDPPAAVQSVSLIDHSGRGSPDWNSIGASAGEVVAPLVQEELTAGTYYLRIEATPTCCWMAQLVLNSMLSWEAPPRAFRRASSLPEPIMLGTGKNPDFRIEETGTYAMDLRVGDFAPDIAPRHTPQALCPFSLSLRAADYRHHHLARGTEHDASWPSWVFLGAGDWTVLMETSCQWELVIRPMVGPSGGGAYWF